MDVQLAELNAVRTWELAPADPELPSLLVAYVVQQGGRAAKGPIKWGINGLLLFLTAGLWIFAFPWWPRHRIYGGANAAAVASSVVNITAPAPTPSAPVVHATITATKDPAEELRKVKGLHDDGILTDAEYETQRAYFVAQLHPEASRAVPSPPPGQLPPPG